MSDSQKKQIPIPAKHEGAQHDIAAETETATKEEAMTVFNNVTQRLLDVNNWDKLCGVASAIFTLTDSKGREVEGPPQEGFYIKIDVPGPGPRTGDGFDWVRVEEIKNGEDGQADSQFILMRVRPASNPGTNDTAVAHFFSDAATSNFLVSREKNIVTAAVLGRNEIPNTSADISLPDKLRNAVVGTSAALGISNPQWKSLVNGLLGKH